MDVSTPLIVTFFESLPGRLASAAAVVHGQLWLIMDPDKIGSVAPARNLVVDLIDAALN